jgi:hypothetical protein
MKILSAEKGIEYLLQALPAILERFPGASILNIGPREPVGEYAYAQRLAPLRKRCGDKYRHIGTVTNEELAAFYATCDVHVLPSVNSTESFGMVAGRGRPVRHTLCRQRPARRARRHPPDGHGVVRTAAGCHRAGRGRLRSHRQPQPLRMFPGQSGQEILAGGDCGAV